MRIAFKMHLKPGMAVEYQRRHDQLWPDLAQLLKKAGISDYSIFFDPETNTLFALHQQHGDAGAQDLGKEEIVQKWWAYMADIMETHPDHSPISKPLKEVFHLD